MKILLVKSSRRQASKMTISWFHRLISRSTSSSVFYTLLLITLCSSVCFVHHASASEIEAATQDNSNMDESRKSVPSNHRQNDQEESLLLKAKLNAGGRNGRQYDGSLTSAGTGSYGSISGDGAYVAQVPISSSNYGSASNSAANYANDLGSSYHTASSYHDPLSMARGYPISSHMGSMHPSSGYPGLSSMFPPPSLGGAGGLMGGSMFPLMSKGFDVSEIVCTAIAVAIGAVIVGAPFVLIYLFVMNQMNGNSNMGPSGGAISLTGPNSNTNVSGRKKRQTSLSEALFKQLSPLVDSEQVASTFKSLMNSIAKYQM